MMFSGLPSFFNLPKAATETDGAAATMFAGVPLMNPLLNDAQTNIDNLDERITQLESVSQWLNMNLQMVNTSVQQLQVQKQTLQALAEWQKLSKDALNQLNPKNTEAAPEPAAIPPQKTASKRKAKTTETPPTAEATPSDAFDQMAQSWWNGLQQQFVQLAQPLVDAANQAEPPKPAARTRKNPAHK